MPAVLSRAARPAVLAAAALLTVVGLAVPALADDGVSTGDTVVGELVQAWPEHQDPADAAAAPLSWIATSNGSGVRVDTGDVADLPVGATVAVTVGTQVRDSGSRDEGLAPARQVLSSDVLAQPQDAPTAPASAPYTDEVTVVMVQPPGLAQDDMTAQRLVDTINGPVADFWESQSNGAITLHGTAPTTGWVATTARCDDPYALWTEVAGDSQVDFTPGPGKHLLLYVPGYPSQTPGCAYGLAEVGSSRTAGGYLYVRAAETSVIAHELGHNFGLGHSSEVQCDAAMETGTCRTWAYNDLYDVMGASWDQVGSLNVVQEALIGLLPQAQELDLSASSGGGTYTLAAVSGRSGTRAIKLTDSGGTAYWLELRTAAGQDAWLGDPAANRPGLQTGVLLRRAGDTSDTSLLLDGTPSPASGWSADGLQALPLGTTIPISGGAFAVTVTSVDPAGTAAVRIDTAATVSSQIGIAYGRLGGATGVLGAPTSAETCGLPGGGCQRSYANGRIYWSAASGAHMLRGAILDRYLAVGGPAGLGYPTADDGGVPTGDGAMAVFQGGVIYWSAATGAHVVRGAILALWRTYSAQAGVLGYPTGDDAPAANGGYLTTFAGGTVYWSPWTGAHMVRGAILARYLAVGGPAALGYPTADDGGVPTGDGAMAVFQGGVIYWSRATDAHVVRGAILAHWRELGAQAGPLGYPTGDDAPAGNGGYLTTFAGGTMYWGPATGAHMVRGALLAQYVALGGPPALGYPIDDDGGAAGGAGALVRLQGGEIYWSRSTGAHVVRGAILAKWHQLGAQLGPLGYPTGDDAAVGDGGYLTTFAGGTIYWSAATGAHMMRGALLARYVALGGPPALSYPFTDDDGTATRDGAYVRLVGGEVYWSPTTGAHYVRGNTANYWKLRGAQAGSLGYPTTDSTARGDGTGWDTRFQRGTLTEATGGTVSQTG